MATESKVLAISPSKTQERSASTGQLIREWLFRFGVEHKEDVAPKLPLWLEAFGGMDAAILERLFSRALRTCKFFPKVSEILEPLESAEKNATPEAAEVAWSRVLEIRRVHWNPDIPGSFKRAVEKLSERVRQAARAAGVLRDFDSVAELHTWAKKRFVESFIAYGENQQDSFLLPDGEIKRLLTDAAQVKALPAPAVEFHALHERGLRYADQNRLLGTYREASRDLPSWEPEKRAEIEAELQSYGERFGAAVERQQNFSGKIIELEEREGPSNGECDGSAKGSAETGA
jgi:hypothetical protein